MQDVKLADISGTKKEYLTAKTDEHENNSKLKNIRDLYRGINEFRKVTSLELKE